MAHHTVAHQKKLAVYSVSAEAMASGSGRLMQLVKKSRFHTWYVSSRASMPSSSTRDRPACLRSSVATHRGVHQTSE